MNPHLSHRQQGYALLNGHGLEIGALHQPAVLPKNCSVVYSDICTKKEGATVFGEIDSKGMVEVDIIFDLDRDDPGSLAEAPFDFVILNHVIEHLANPIRAVGVLFELVSPSGQVLISAPDKDYTFDRDRALTPFEHLRREYHDGVTEVSDDHYVDFLRGVHPEIFEHPDIDRLLPQHIANVRRRREHAHVWSSTSFREFMDHALRLLGIRATRLFEHYGDQNGFEYFSVWRKEA